MEAFGIYGFNEAGAQGPGRPDCAAVSALEPGGFNEAGAQGPGRRTRPRRRAGRRAPFNEAGAQGPGRPGQTATKGSPHVPSMRPGHKAPEDPLAWVGVTPLVSPSMRPGHKAPEDGPSENRSRTRILKHQRERCGRIAAATQTWAKPMAVGRQKALNFQRVAARECCVHRRSAKQPSQRTGRQFRR